MIVRVQYFWQRTWNIKTKHIDVQYHFVREMVENRKVLLEKVDIVENVADSLKIL